MSCRRGGLRRELGLGAIVHQRLPAQDFGKVEVFAGVEHFDANDVVVGSGVDVEVGLDLNCPVGLARRQANVEGICFGVVLHAHLWLRAGDL